MFLVVSYDIHDDRRRARVAKLLEGYGYRVQYSVFECELDGAQRRRLRRQLRPLLDLSVDSVRFYPLYANMVAEIRILGQGQVTEDPPYHEVRWP